MSSASDAAAYGSGEPDAAHSSDALPWALLDGIAFGLLLEDPSGHVAYINQPLRHLFSLTSTQTLDGLPFRDVLLRLFEASGSLPPALVDAVNKDPADLSGQVWSGLSERSIEITRTPLSPSLGVLWQFRPVDAVPTSEDASRRPDDPLQRHNTYREALHQTTLDLVNRLDLNDLLQSIVERAALLGGGDGYIYLVEPDEKTIIVRYGSGIFKQFIGFKMSPGEGIGGKVWVSGQPLVVDAYDSWTGRSDAFAENLIGAVAGIPLSIGGQIIGVIGVARLNQSPAFRDDEVRILGQLGELASLALENARLYRSAQDEIAERKATEDALRQSESRFRSVISAMGEGIVVFDSNGVIADMNAATERMFDVTRQDMIGQTLSIFDNRLLDQSGAPLPTSRHPAAQTLATGQPQTGVLLGVRLDDGQVRWVLLNAQPVTEADDTLVSVVVSFSDVTRQKQIQAELHRRIDMLAALQQVDFDLNQSLDIDYVLQTSLDCITRFGAVPSGFIVLIEDEAVQRIYANPDDLTAAEQAVARWQDGEPWARLLTARQLQRISGDTHAQIVLPLLSHDRLVGLLALDRDPANPYQDDLAFLELVGARIATAVDNARLFQASQTRLAENQAVYLQLKKLEQLKTQMIRVAAHDLRSPLGVIGGYVTILRDDLAPTNPAYAPFFEAIFRALERMEQMTSDILSLERIHATDTSNYKPVSLSSLIVQARDEYHDRVAAGGLSLDMTLEHGDLAVRGDAVQIYEAISNLIGNAIKYTPPGGRIHIRGSVDRDHALFQVSDTGYGIPLESQAALFQPFYRVRTDETRAIDGTGLGLYLVKGIVEQHGGVMRFESTPGQGSTFGFVLPLTPDE